MRHTVVPFTGNDGQKGQTYCIKWNDSPHTVAVPTMVVSPLPPPPMPALPLRLQVNEADPQSLSAGWCASFIPQGGGIQSPK